MLTPSTLRVRVGSRLDVGAVYDGGSEGERSTTQRAMGCRLWSAVRRASKGSAAQRTESACVSIETTGRERRGLFLGTGYAGC
jgi:hypothetical protein